MTAAEAETMSRPTKARTAAQKRRDRRNARFATITLPMGETAPQRPTGRDRRHINQRDQNVDKVALTARARFTGCTVEEARDVLASDDMGRCIRYMRKNPEDRRALLNVWQGISAAWANYCARCLSLTPNAQSASLPMLPEPMQTDPSARVDLRSPDEKDQAARRVWDEWNTAFNALPVECALAVAQASRCDGPPLWDTDELRPTRQGCIAVKALASLHDARNY